MGVCQVSKFLFNSTISIARFGWTKNFHPLLIVCELWSFKVIFLAYVKITESIDFKQFLNAIQFYYCSQFGWTKNFRPHIDSELWAFIVIFFRISRSPKLLILKFFECAAILLFGWTKNFHPFSYCFRVIHTKKLNNKY